MSPEEFDNRLRATFKEESLPPADRSWQNIQTRLDKKPFLSSWKWIAPLILLIATAVVWVSQALFVQKDPEIASQNEVVLEETTSITHSSAPNANESGPNSVQSNSIGNQENLNDGNSITNNHSPSNADHINRPVQSSGKPGNSNNASSQTGHNSSEAKGNSNSPSGEGNQNENRPKQTSGKGNNNGTGNQGAGNPSHNQGENLIEENSIFSGLGIDLVNLEPYLYRMTSVNSLMIPAKNRLNNRLMTKSERRQIAINYSGDFSDKKWWLNFGIGPQTNINEVVTVEDSMDYVHKDLWANRDKMTGNGIGYQGFVNIQRKFGKNLQFSLETGLEVSHRKEDIKFNEFSYDIRLANQYGKTSHYLKVYGYIITPPDTTRFSLTESFAYVNKNRYTYYSIPLRFGYEQKISPNSFISLGLGGGLSYLKKVNSKHYSLTQQDEVELSSKMFSANANTRLAIYTNYNGLVQLGIYGQYQMYLNPLNVHNHYKVRMSDLQYGFTCRVPLK